MYNLEAGMEGSDRFDNSYGGSSRARFPVHIWDVSVSAVFANPHPVPGSVGTKYDT